MPLPLFGKSHKSPPDIVKNLKESLSVIEKGDKKSDKAAEEVNRWLQAVKGIIYGQEGQEPHTEQVRHLFFYCLRCEAATAEFSTWKFRNYLSAQISFAWSFRIPFDG
uniref:Rap-GAP domain-containing protein n=1 Tax=Ascaris lumbricoides TaxID=6252 RepID=A0A0M3HH08_ASCLU